MDEGENNEIEELSEVVREVNSGNDSGEKSFNIKVRSILWKMVGKKKDIDIMEISKIFKNEGVVGIEMEYNDYD